MHRLMNEISKLWAKAAECDQMSLMCSDHAKASPVNEDVAIDMAVAYKLEANQLRTQAAEMRERVPAVVYSFEDEC